MSRADSPSWTAQKKSGDVGEALVAIWLRTKQFEVYAPIPYGPNDLLVQALVEVKNDLKAAESGNLAFEVEYRDKPSGISASRANWWAHVYSPTEFLFMSVEALRAEVLAGSFSEVRGGDGNLTRLRLVPINVALAWKSARRVNLGLGQ